MGKEIYLYGIHPIEEALKNPNRTILEIGYITPPSFEIPKEIKKYVLNKQQIENLVGKNALHQGIIAKCLPLPNKNLNELLKEISKKETALILLLDQVSDPHNIGAILRSALGFYADAVIIPSTNSPEETSVLAKSASGALEWLPLVRVSNLVRALEELKKDGFWCIGLDGQGKQNLSIEKLPKKCAFVLGAEGSGLRRLTAEKCDFLAFLPINSQLESLNVSNAACIACYEWTKQHLSKKN